MFLQTKNSEMNSLCLQAQDKYLECRRITVLSVQKWGYNYCYTFKQTQRYFKCS